MSDDSDRFAELVRAADRTTHAVRALVRFLLIESISAIVGGIFLALSSAFVLVAQGIYWLFVVLAIGAWAVGIIWACVAALEELRLSATPARVSTLARPPAPLGSPTSSASPSAGTRAASPQLSSPKPPTIDPDRRIFFTLSLAQRAAWHAAHQPSLRSWDEDNESFEVWLERSAT